MKDAVMNDAVMKDAVRKDAVMKYATGLILLAIVWLIAWYWSTAQSIAAIWSRSDTFAHGYMIVPISAWLIWRRRHDLAALDPRPNFLVLPLLALTGFGWLVGRMVGAGVVQQYALVLMIPLLVWTILGTQVVRELAFPLFFLILAVPFGEFLVPPLMEQTADFTVFALRLSGIPVYREGLFFTLPSGNWSIVEACSGLRYLIASVTLGFLYAYLTYRSLARRAIFVAFSLIVPVVANWLRAYMIVMIGHLSGMKYAVGVDHLIYGWVFFGAVMLLLFWVGSFWREDLDPRQPAPSSVPPVIRTQSSRAAIMTGTVAAAVMVAVWPVATTLLEGSGDDTAPALQAPPSAGGWQPVAGSLTSWTPRFLKPRIEISQTYAKDAARAGLYIGYYGSQRQGSQLISSQNMLVSGEENDWRNAGEIKRPVVLGNAEISALEAKLQGRSSRPLLVWRWYRVDGQNTLNPFWAKLLQAKSKLLGRGDDGAVIVVYASYVDQPQAAAQAMQDFLNAMLPAITRSLDNARRLQPGT